MVDASGSVSDEEFSLQVRGLAEAFRHRSVAQAIRAAGDLGLAVALIQWAGSRQHALSVDWTVIHDEKTAGDFAEKVENMPRSAWGVGALGRWGVRTPLDASPESVTLRKAPANL